MQGIHKINSVNTLIINIMIISCKNNDKAKDEIKIPKEVLMTNRNTYLLLVAASIDARDLVSGGSVFHSAIVW